MNAPVPPSATLAVRSLHAAFCKRGVAYCHFKSNLHLAAGLAGQTDLDLLLDANRREEAELALLEAGFKQFRAIGHLAYPGVTDYLAMDDADGRLVHLHVHYRLVLGEKHLKGYRLPWESRILADRRLDAQEDFHASSIEWEMLLLLVRAALKARGRDRFFALFGGPECDRDISHEFAWLLERLDRARFNAIVENALGQAPCAIFAELIDHGLSLARLTRLRRALRPTLLAWRTYSPPCAWILRHCHEALWLFGGLSRRLLHPARPSKRISLLGGRVIAFLGCDGSGKSTLLKQLRPWLAWKIDVLPIYHGSGDGPASLIRWPMKIAHRMIKRKTPDSAPTSESGEPSKPKSGRIRRALRVVWALALTSEKAAKLRRQTKARNLGMVVLADRYPQTEIAGFNDGPLLHEWTGHPSRLLRFLARWERSCYTRFAAYPPDLAFKLSVSAEEAQRRKPEADLAELRRRIDAVARIPFNDGTRVVELDAMRPIEEVILAAKREIWKLL